MQCESALAKQTTLAKLSAPVDARGRRKATRQGIDENDLGTGADGLDLTRLLTFEDKLEFARCVPHGQASQRGVLLQQGAGRVVFRQSVPPGRLRVSVCPAQRAVREDSLGHRFVLRIRGQPCVANCAAWKGGRVASLACALHSAEPNLFMFASVHGLVFSRSCWQVTQFM